MNKVELANVIAGATGLTKKQANAAVEAFCTAIGKAMRNGEKVTLTGFGTFEARLREARDCRNPSTGESVRVSAHRVPVFKAGKALKDALL